MFSGAESQTTERGLGGEGEGARGDRQRSDDRKKTNLENRIRDSFQEIQTESSEERFKEESVEVRPAEHGVGVGEEQEVAHGQHGHDS